MNAKDADWPSLPPIRTSSYNARVSCETLNLPASEHAPTTSTTPSSTSHAAKPASKSASADASPLGTSSHTSHVFSSCFPHRFGKGHGHDGGKKGSFDAGGLFRSMFGPVVPRYPMHRSTFASGMSTPPSRTGPPSMSTSPSGRMKTPGSATSPINLMRSGGSTPHSGAALRASKGHAGHAFTMMPPDVVGKKKPPNYESDEPKSPEVTCIGKVRRKHCKATWDALVKEKHNDGKMKKGKVKRLSGEMSQMSGEIVRKGAHCEKKTEGAELTVSAKLSKQRSQRRQSRDFESFSTELDACVRIKRGDDQEDGNYSKGVMESGREDASTRIRQGDDSFSCLDSSIGDSCALNMPAGDCTQSVPSNCLLLMKKGSRNRSAHYPSDLDFVGEQGHTSNQWSWGQVLT
ncbi:hypothetical protein GOP47_0020271 [Adiantum capillus-veneris]|uniref:Uncharacterized protein n=1 Tax=Adiantum capillus-veneris TaxID=13818 RepID=A0A9D4ZAG2_ADICA|nr:hypothetical protein GOP47_0020271 [Adiantum capillus-veneris]